MSAHESHGPSYVTIWYFLLGLLAVGLVVAYLPIPKTLGIAVILVTALVKAFLVGSHYMHLKSESTMILTLISIPFILLAIMVIGLWPDVVSNYQGPTGPVASQQAPAAHH